MDVKGKKIYHLEICFDDSTHELEYVREYIDGSSKALYYGELDLVDYFDEEGLSYINEFYEVGIS